MNMRTNTRLRAVADARFHHIVHDHPKLRGSFLQAQLAGGHGSSWARHEMHARAHTHITLTIATTRQARRTNVSSARGVHDAHWVRLKDEGAHVAATNSAAPDAATPDAVAPTAAADVATTTNTTTAAAAATTTTVRTSATCIRRWLLPAHITVVGHGCVRCCTVG